jgi:hypothetical protein
LATVVDAPLVGVGGGGNAVSAAVYGCVAATVSRMPSRACEQEKVRAGNTHVVVVRVCRWRQDVSEECARR